MAIVPVIERTFTDCMEQLQEAYVASVAATAGCSYEPVDRDVYGADALLVRQPDALLEEVSIYVQLKNTTMVRPNPGKSEFSYQFGKRRDMEMLVQQRKHIKKILVVMCTPPIQANWTVAEHDRLHMLHCCYWKSLEGLDIPVAERPSIRVSTANIFDASALTKILDQIEVGGELNGI